MRYLKWESYLEKIHGFDYDDGMIEVGSVGKVGVSTVPQGGAGPVRGPEIT